MSGMPHDSAFRDVTAANDRLAEAGHLRAIEGNPLTAEEIAMFEMFEREGWPPERRRAHIFRRIEDRGRIVAVEYFRGLGPGGFAEGAGPVPGDFPANGKRRSGAGD